MRLLNLGLRALTLASKFFLIFFLARFLEPAELGLYGLLIATTGYAIYLLGLDFYTFTTREVIRRASTQWGGLVKSQGALTLLLYVLFTPLLLLVFTTGSLPWGLAGWFFALLLLEHLNQEAMRLLIAISQPLVSSLVLFLRQGAWVIAVLPLMYFNESLRTLETVLLAWTVGGGLAFAVAVVRFIQVRVGGWREQVDWQWIVRGLKVALPLLLATLAIRGLFTFDRYWFEGLFGLEALGAYVLFISIGNALLSFLDAGVFMFLYPRLIQAHQRQDADAFRIGIKRLWRQTLLLVVVFSALAALLIGPLLEWLDKPLYLDWLLLFPWILLAMSLYAASMIPHYALYAQGKDRPLIHSQLAGMIVFIPATWLFSLSWPLLAIPLGLSAAFLLIVVWKTTAYVRLTPVRYRHHSPAPQAL